MSGRLVALQDLPSEGVENSVLGLGWDPVCEADWCCKVTRRFNWPSSSSSEPERSHGATEKAWEGTELACIFYPLGQLKIDM